MFSSSLYTTYPYYLYTLLVSLEALVPLSVNLPRSIVALIPYLVRLTVSRFGVHPIVSWNI